ncbi:urea amidolyase family protein [Arthrobacter sp. GMC3]|uniref:5-oxoprolinase subunit B/C family protein n=1 Tax=Arthrobacter sp. GMC3 TaxID=2058894 RepID=UPI002157CD14|nr:urea amidolyase family protein [Arthrobacter sp. GMC3]
MGQHLRILPVGDQALLVELADLTAVMALQAFLASNTPAGTVDVVPAARTVLVTASSPRALAGIERAIRGADLSASRQAHGTLVTLETVYDGAELATVAQLAGMGVQGLVEWHSGQEWTAAFAGFAPGFMYLTPEVAGVSVPRRASPRTAVPAGSVALGGEFSAVYPGPSPGGWALIGRTNQSLWDLSRPVPALIQPGDRVRFAPVREMVTVTASAASPTIAVHAPGDHGLRVLAPGMQTTVQDLGRAGFAGLGVTGSGALDRAALRRANRMVGNAGSAVTQGASGAAGLETVVGGMSLQAVGSHVVAVTGGAVTLSVSRVSGQLRGVPTDVPFLLCDGESLMVHAAPGVPGFRSYLAVRGGLDVPAVLGSRATDLLSGTGPAQIAAGDFLPVAPAPPGSVVGFPEPGPPVPDAVTVLHFVPGPRADWFTTTSQAAFTEQRWSVGAQSNRIGLRLEGTPLQRELPGEASAADSELPSEGMGDGAIQVPPSGLPVLFLADHPVTGGYPVIGVVVRADLDKAAQLAPGQAVTFRALP